MSNVPLESGNLKLVNYDGKVFQFGNLESKLSADIKINNPNFYFNIITFFLFPMH